MADPVPEPSFREALRTWARIGLLSFGGPAGQIAVMHRILVEERRWVGERRFLHALNYCMLLPGPEAQQLATYVGWLLHGVPGGLAAGTLFVLPGFVSILGLSLAYASFQHGLLIQGVFFGLKPAVLAIVVQAVVRIGRRALASRTHRAIAAAAFVAMFFLGVPFPIVVLGSALAGWLVHRHGAARGPSPGLVRDDEDEAHAPRIGTPRGGSQAMRALRTAAIFAVLWWAPVAALVLLTGIGSVWSQQGVFFSQAAVVTFGGAYAVLAYVAQEAVERFAWLEPGEMLDGLGMAETTPGPLIMVVQFVGFMAAYRNPGTLDPLLAGVLGSVLTTWVTFLPCFLFVFVGAPWVEQLRSQRGLGAALSGITAGVVGVILNLALWFAVHVLFARVDVWRWGPLQVLAPDAGSLDPGATAIAAGAGLALFVARWGLARTLLAAAAAGLLLRAVAATG